jgi:hypothetical protein
MLQDSGSVSIDRSSRLSYLIPIWRKPMLNLTPEQQAIFDRVVGIVTQNNDLRQQFKTAIEELHKQPNWDDAEYMSDSDDPPAANARAANNAVDREVLKIAPGLKKNDSQLFYGVCIAICHNFLDV